MKKSLSWAVLGTGVALGMGTVPALAIDQGDWLIHGRLLYVSPNDGNDNAVVGGATVAGTSDTIEVDEAFTLGIDISYMMTKNVAVTLMLDTSSEHELDVDAPLATALGAASGVDLLETRVLPPSLILQYHFMPDGKYRPYVGAGVNYTIFFDERKGTALRAAGATDLELDESLGLVLQAGMDMDLGNDWSLNVDLKYVNIETEATFKVAGVTPASVDVDIDPLVLGIGVGKRF